MDAGMGEIKVCAEPFNEPGESNEANSCDISTVDIAEPLLADLKINYIEVSPAVLTETGQGRPQPVVRAIGLGGLLVTEHGDWVELGGPQGWEETGQKRCDQQRQHAEA